MKSTQYNAFTRHSIMLLCLLVYSVSSFAQGLTLTGTSHVEAGYYVTLRPSALGGSWSTSNAAIATVDRGVVNGIAAGTVTISYSVTTGGVPTTTTTVVTVDPVTTVCQPWGSSFVGASVGGSAFTIANDGTQYSAYMEYGSNQVTVKKYNGTSWTVVGTAGFTTAGATAVDIKVDRNGTPYVAFGDIANGSRMTVMKYNGSSWVLVGSAGFSSTTKTVKYCKLAIDSVGNLYTAYTENNGSGYYYDLSAQKFNGSSWVSMGASYGVDFTPGSADEDNISLALDTHGLPWIAFPGYDRVTVVNYTGSSWNTASGADFDWGTNVSLAISRNNIPYVSYKNAGLIVVKKLQSSGWTTIRNAGAVVGWPAGYTSVAVDANEKVYVAYQTFVSSQFEGVVEQLNGATWSALGYGGADGYGTQLVINPDGAAYCFEFYGFVSNMTKLTTSVPANSLSTTLCVGDIATASNSLGNYNLWQSSNQAVAQAPTSLNPNIVQAISAGTAIITYTNGTCQQTTNVTVNASPTITASGPTTICAGSTISLTGTPAGGTWTSLNPSAATVDPDGTTHALTPGTVNIRYQQGGCSSSQSLTIDGPAISIDGPATVEQTHVVYLKGYISGGVWSSSNTNASVGTTPGITKTGNVTGLNVGTATISYTLSNSCGTSVATKVVSVQPFTCTAWNYLGTPGFSTGVVPYVSMAVDAAGTPYVGYTDGSSGPAKVRTYTGGNWVAVGGPISVGKALDTKIAIAPGSVPYVAYQDAGDSNKIKVNKYDGTNWVAVGTSITSSGKYPSLAMATDGTPYVAFKDLANGKKASVVKYNGSSWVAVGTAGLSAGIAETPVLQLDNSGTPYLAFIDSAVGGKATVMKFDGSTWTAVGGAGVSAGGAQYISLAIDGTGTPYISYLDRSNSFYTSVLKYNGSSWTYLGAPGFTTDQAAATSLVIGPGNTPYLCYPSSDYTGYWASVVKFDGTGWPYVGTRSFSGGQAVNPVMCIDGSGNMYAAFGDATVSKYISVVKFGAGLPAIQGNSGVCPGATLALSNSNGGGTWSSSNTAVATVGSTGVVTNVSTGAATISYSVGSSCVATKDITSGAFGGVITGPSTVRQGATMTLTSSVPLGVWSSSTSNATVSFSGVVTGLSIGTATISYTVYTTCGTAISTKDITITLPGISGPTFISGSGSVTLTNPISGGTWSTACTEIATVSDSGVVSAVSSGLATITYAAAGSSATTVVTVETSSTAITGTRTVCQGAATTLGHPVTGGAWSSGNTSVATVSSTGVITGVTAGTASISYAYGSGCTSVATVTVNPLPHAGSIVGADSVCQSLSVTLSATGDAGGVWSMYPLYSFPTATINPTTGVMTPDITYYFMGVTAALPMYKVTNGCGTDSALKLVAIVSSIPGVSIIGPSHVCVGAEVTFSLDGQPGYWKGSSSLAIDSATGIATAVAPGVTWVTYIWYPSLCSSEWVWPEMLVTVDSTVATNPTISGPSGVQAGNSMTWSASESGGTWSVSNSHATVSAAGVVTGVSAGTAIISYTINDACGTRRGTSTIMVIPPSIGGPLIVTGTGNITLTNSATGGTWSSACSNVATVSAGGVVTGVSNGITTITYTLNGAYTTAMVTVNSVTTAITGALAVCAGNNTSLGHPLSGGTWSSGNAAVATANSTTGMIGGVTVGTANITYNYGGGCASIATATVNPATDPGTLGGASSVNTSATTVLTASVSGGSWSASNGNATVSSGGVVTGVSGGTVVISYAVSGSCGVAVATKTMTVTGTAPVTGALTVCSGSTTTLSNTTTGGSWSSGNNSIATVNSSGVVTGAAPGVALISYTTASGYVTSSVTVLALPNPITGTMSLCSGTVTTLSSTTTGGSWTNSNTTAATISSTGVVSGLSAGNSTITYTSANGCARTAIVTVIAQPAVSGAATVCAGATTTLVPSVTGGAWGGGSAAATVSGGVVTALAAGTANITYTVGGSCRSITTVTVNAQPANITGTAKACPGTTITLTDATTGGSWSSDNSGIATAGGTLGAITGVSAGTTLVSYTGANGCSRSVVLTVNASPAAIGSTASTCAGSTTTLTNTSATQSWTSGNTTVATISAGGVVTGVNAGTANITFTASGTGCTATTIVTINGTPAAIGGSATACVGSTTTLTNTVSGGTWSSGNTSLATIDAVTGVVTGAAAGNVTMTYTTGSGCYKTRALTVTTASAITGSTSVCTGGTTTLTSWGSGSWSSSNTAIATTPTGTSGVVSGISAGTAIITFVPASGCPANTTVTVVAPPAAITGSTVICSGQTSSLSTTSTGGSWSSSNTATATIGSASGVVSAVGTQGTVTITYAYNATCRTTTNFTVNPLPAVINGTYSVCATATTTLTDVTAAGTWSSSNTAVATVGTGLTWGHGAVSGITAGTANISFTISATGCARSVVVTVDPCSRPMGNETATTPAFELYPNPTTGAFTVVTESAGTLQVFTLDGRQVAQYPISNGINNLALSKELTSGVYMCRYNTSEGNTVVIRLVLEH